MNEPAVNRHPQSFLKIASALTTGCVVLDIDLSAAGGLAVPREFLARGIRLPVIVLGLAGDVELAVQAMKAGAVEWLQEPYAPEALVSAVASGWRRLRSDWRRGQRH